MIIIIEMISVEEIQKQIIKFEIYFKNLIEELTKLLNQNIPAGKFFILDSHSVWHIISSRTTGISFNVIYLEEFLGLDFPKYKIVVVARKGSWKNEFQIAINKEKSYSAENLNKAKNEIF